MFLCVIKTVILVFFLYGLYSGIIALLERVDQKNYSQCVFLDVEKISNIEEAVYNVFLYHPDTEIFILNQDGFSPHTKEIISKLCKKYDFVYSVEDK